METRHRYLLLITLLLLTACSRPLRGGGGTSTPEPALPAEGPASSRAPSGQTGSFDAQITSGSQTRQFRLHVPENLPAGAAVPLVINLHGLNSNSMQEENLTGMSAKADREGFIVVYPDGVNATWFTGPGAEGQADLQFMRDLIAFVDGEYDLDPKRVYATGLSNGGGMANRLGCELADLIAAIAPDSGAYNFWNDCDPSRPVPVLAFHGLDDNVVPYDGGAPLFMEPPIQDWASAWAARNGCSASPTESSLEGGVTVQTWSGCRENADVILYTLADHGHSWPGSSVMPASITSQAVNATEIMWDFFKSHPMP